eukprot:g12927.t1
MAALFARARQRSTLSQGTEEYQKRWPGSVAAPAAAGSKCRKCGGPAASTIVTMYFPEYTKTQRTICASCGAVY